MLIEQCFVFALQLHDQLVPCCSKGRLHHEFLFVVRSGSQQVGAVQIQGVPFVQDQRRQKDRPNRARYACPPAWRACLHHACYLRRSYSVAACCACSSLCPHDRHGDLVLWKEDAPGGGPNGGASPNPVPTNPPVLNSCVFFPPYSRHVCLLTASAVKCSPRPHCL